MTEPAKEYLQPGASPGFNETIEGVAFNAVDHPTTWNVPYLQLLENDHWLRGKITETAQQVQDILGSDPVNLSDQLDALVQYGAQQVFTERAANVPVFTVISAVSGDDSIDMESTAGIEPDQHYYLIDAGNVQTVRVKTVLSAQRVVLTQPLLSTVAAGATLSRLAPGNYATPKLGNTARGAVLHAEGDNLQVRQWTGTAWQALVRRADGGWDVPAGTERISITGTPTQVAVISELPIGVTRRPVNASPIEGAQGQTTTPVLVGGDYYPLYGVPQAKREFRVIAAGGDVSDPLYTATETPLGADPVLQHQIATPLAVSGQYLWQYRDQNVEGEWGIWSTPTGFGTAATYITAPTVVSPAGGAVDVPEQPVIELSAFAVTGGTDTHAATSVRIKNAAGAVVWEQTAGAQLNNITPPAGVLQEGGLSYTIEGRHHGETYGASAWGPASSFTTAASFIPDGSEIGKPYGGGYVAGKVVSDYDGETYLLIVSDGDGDSALKDGSTHAWRTAQTSVTTTGGVPPMTLADGRANHNALKAAGIANFPAAKWIEDNCNAGLGLNGHTDWYLPSRDELEVLYRAFKPDTTANNTNARYSSGFGGDGLTHGTNASSRPTGAAYTGVSPGQTSVESFKAAGADAFTASDYWSSTEINASYAWVQYFNNGTQNAGNKTGARRVRAVRRIKL